MPPIPVCAPRHFSASGPVDKALPLLFACEPNGIIGSTASNKIGGRRPRTKGPRSRHCATTAHHLASPTLSHAAPQGLSCPLHRRPSPKRTFPHADSPAHPALPFLPRVLSQSSSSRSRTLQYGMATLRYTYSISSVKHTSYIYSVLSLQDGRRLYSATR